MANKSVPESIGSVTLHPRARSRTNVLLKDLESVGVVGVVEAGSQIDRIRLLASRLFELLERSPVNDEEVGEDVSSLVDDLNRAAS